MRRPKKLFGVADIKRLEALVGNTTPPGAFVRLWGAPILGPPPPGRHRGASNPAEYRFWVTV